MSGGTIPKEVKIWVEERVADFNKKTIKDTGIGYRARIRGCFLYLDRDEFGKTGPICRLT